MAVAIPLRSQLLPENRRQQVRGVTESVVNSADADSDSGSLATSAGESSTTGKGVTESVANSADGSDSGSLATGAEEIVASR